MIEKRTRVLIVEDATQLVPLMVRALERDGYEVIGVTTLTEALAIAGTVDCFVLDRELPNGDGTSLMAQYPAVPTLVVSGTPPADLYKPFRPDALRAMVRRKLGRPG